MPFVALLPNTKNEVEEGVSSKYALFPFVQQYELPWMSASGDVFRGRRISSWLGDSTSDAIGLSSNASNSKSLTVDLVGYVVHSFV